MYQLMYGREVVAEGTREEIHDLWAESGGTRGGFTMRRKP